MTENLPWFRNPEWWSAIGTVGATVVALFSIFYFEFLRKLFEKVKVEIFTGDSVDFVISKDLKIYKMQLHCNFVNKSNKFAVIHKVILKLFSEDGEDHRLLKWRLFFKDIEGGGGVIPESNKPYPACKHRAGLEVRVGQAAPLNDQLLVFSLLWRGVFVGNQLNLLGQTAVRH